MKAFINKHLVKILTGLFSFNFVLILLSGFISADSVPPLLLITLSAVGLLLETLLVVITFVLLAFTRIITDKTAYWTGIVYVVVNIVLLIILLFKITWC